VERGAVRLLLERAEAGLAVVAAAIFVAITLTVVAEVLLRYGFNRPIEWSVEISEYALIWITFLGAPYVLRIGGHVRVDVFISQVPAGGRRWLALICCILGAVICAFLTVYGVDQTWTEYARATYKPTGVDVPTWLTIIPLPVGCFLLCARFVVMAADLATGRLLDMPDAHAGD
jgi:TRAP-type C4-dicarboxylate transport system permease small subunit